MTWSRVLSASIYGAAGAAVAHALLNRLLHLLEGRRGKPAISLVTASFLTFGLGIVGYRSGLSAWLAFPAACLVCFCAAEIRRLATRRRFLSSGCPGDVPMNSWAKPLTTRSLVLPMHNVALPKRQNRLRVVHLSDLHVGSRLPQAYFADVVEQVRRLEPDLILLTGDFVAGLRFCSRLTGILERLEARNGAYAILGNHDWWFGAAEIRQALTDAGIDVIGNGARQVECPGGPCLLAGCEHPWSEDTWTPPQAGDAGLCLGLTHSPHNVRRLGRAGATAVFAGHYHGGQVALPGFGPLIVPDRYGRVFDRGHFLVNGVHLFVSAGVGLAELPARIYCPPEIVTVDFQGA